MCLIIYNPDGKMIPKNYIENAYETNKDGFGIMWPENGRLKVIKGMMDFEQIWNILSGFNGKKYACHFRFRTHGKKTMDQCHPHKIVKKKVYMMHNGVLDAFPNHPVKSDTMLFAAAIRKQIYSGKFDPSNLFTKEVIKSFDDSVGSNKLIFMDGSGQAAIINEELGSWDDGCWYSNTYSYKKYQYITKNFSNQSSLWGDDCDTAVISQAAATAMSEKPSLAKQKAIIMVSRNRKEWSKQQVLETFGEFPVKGVAADDDDSEFLAAWLADKEERDKKRNRMICKKFRQQK